MLSKLTKCLSIAESGKRPETHDHSQEGRKTIEVTIISISLVIIVIVAIGVLTGVLFWFGYGSEEE